MCPANDLGENKREQVAKIFGQAETFLCTIIKPSIDSEPTSSRFRAIDPFLCSTPILVTAG